jgi:hypothetical protein
LYNQTDARLFPDWQASQDKVRQEFCRLANVFALLGPIGLLAGLLTIYLNGERLGWE